MIVRREGERKVRKEGERKGDAPQLLNIMKFASLHNNGPKGS